jgi:hypothetical protein
MLPTATVPNLTSSIPGEHALPILTDRAKDFITARLVRREPPERIAAALRALFQIEMDPAHLIPFWKGELTPPTQTEHRPDKESVQFPADEVKEPPLTRPAPDETPCVTSEAARPEAPQPFSITLEPDRLPTGTRDIAAHDETEPATQTGHRPDPESLQIPADTVDEPNPGYRARSDALEALAALAKAKLGIAPDPAAATQTGRRQNQKKPSVLTDEMKAFIVRGLARYETPTRVAASVQANFGIEIDRRQVFAYDPTGSRPPAQRWIDLHAATRAKFMQASAEIGIAQKLVRLRMLDRFANQADENNKIDRAAKLLEQAAKECGGFYERFQRPKAAAAPQNAAVR